MNEGSPLKVFVRIKPQPPDSQLCIQTEGTSIFMGEEENSKQFNYDWVADQTSTQEDIFDHVGVPLLLRVLEGYNGTLLAYGQEASGKTYTLQGQNNEGLIQRAITFLFDHIRKKRDEEWKIECSYWQVVQENMLDLLEKGVPFVNGMEELKKAEVKTANAARDCFKRGCSVLDHAATHVIFTIYIRHCFTEGGKKQISESYIQLIDLSGEGLSDLERVILMKPNLQRFPYRAKFTSMFQEFLGGDCKTSIIATINPNSTFLNETSRILNFAQNARSRRTKPTRKVNICDESTVRKLRGRILELEEENNRLRKIVEEHQARESGARVDASLEIIDQGTIDQADEEL